MKKSFFFIFVLTIALSSCNEDCSAGLGGSLTVVATLKHHSRVIPNQASYRDTVFVKACEQDLPGTNTSDYDTYFVGEASEDHVHLTGLKAGDYYLYAAGWDTSISQRVAGGIPFSTEQETGEVEQTIPVTEEH